MSNMVSRTLREEARRAKCRLKGGFWTECEAEKEEKMQKAREQGLNESKAERFFAAKIANKISGEKEDEFYLKVKQILDEEGEVSDMLGRLTDQSVFGTLDYASRQRYMMDLSERYQRALMRYKKEKIFR